MPVVSFGNWRHAQELFRKDIVANRKVIIFTNTLCNIEKKKRYLYCIYANRTIYTSTPYY